MIVGGGFDIRKQVFSAQTAVGLGAELMIGQKLDSDEIISQLGCKFRRSSYVVVGIVAARHHRDANDCRPQVRGLSGVFQNRLIRNPGEFLVGDGIHVLDIHIDQIQVFKKLYRHFNKCDVVEVQ